MSKNVAQPSPVNASVKTVAALMNRYRPILNGRIATNEFLAQIGRANESHRFLANSTQAVYGRQVAFLTAILQDYKQAASSQIRILDWGCGKCQITYLLRERGFDVASCDVAVQKDDSTFGQEVPIVRARNISVAPLHDPIQMPFGDGEFDCVVSFGVLEHVQSDAASLGEIRRVLKPGGVLFITFLPYFLSWTQAVAHQRGDSYHDRLYHKRRLRSLAEPARFRLAGCWHGQLFPKNSMPLAYDRVLEPLDRFLCWYTPLKYFGTNLEAVLVAV